MKFKPVDSGVELSEDELTEELMKFFNTDIKGYFTDSSYNKVNPPITGVPIESSEVKAYVGDEVGRPINNEINENKMNKKLNLKNKHKKQEVDATEEEIDELFGISKKLVVLALLYVTRVLEKFVLISSYCLVPLYP